MCIFTCEWIWKTDLQYREVYFTQVSKHGARSEGLSRKLRQQLATNIFLHVHSRILLLLWKNS